jgi:hypothetical protein
MDSKGDSWTLRLTGPGALTVLKQNDANGNPSPLNSATDINSITIGGTNPLTSKLVGTVNRGTNSDGRVFFQHFTELPSNSAQFPGLGLGLLSINMPGFWLGNTTPASATTTTAPPPATMSIPDGVDTLNFGGVDTTFNRPAALAGATDDSDTVQLGLPLYGGTRIIIDQSISSSQQAPSSSGTGTTTVQHGVAFAASGRLDLFQANSIQGDATHPPIQFQNENSAASGGGGTIVLSGTGPSGAAQPDRLLTSLNGVLGGAIVGVKGAVTGQIGDLRIGGNATNLTAFVYDSQNNGAKVSNFSIGGETNNILLVAPNGSRNVVFGKGMDNVEIRSHVINTLKANRGAIDSNVIVDRTISSAVFGGDVVGTNVLSGYLQDFTGIINAFRGNTTGTPQPLPQPQNAQPFGGMQVHVAGNVTNSVFAASVEPALVPPATTRVFTNANPTTQTGFGDPNQLVLSGGHIGEKVEGTIDNSTATPKTPTQAFFAQSVTSYAGPVVPPNVPEAPYPVPTKPFTLPGIGNVNVVPTIKIRTPTKPTTTTAAAAANKASSIHAMATTTHAATAKATPHSPASTTKAK